MISGQLDRSSFIAKRDALEGKFVPLFESENDKEKRQKIIDDAWKAEEKLVSSFMSIVEGTPYKFKLGNIYYRNYWKKRTRILSENKGHETTCPRF